jgi:hypothetical protein
LDNSHEDFLNNYYNLSSNINTNNDFQSIGINNDSNKGQSIIPHEYYCDYCSVCGNRVSDPRLEKKLKLNLNFESYKRYSDMFEVIKSFSNNKCDLITDYEWLNIIPFKMRAFGYKSFGHKNWKNCFDYFMNCYLEVIYF